MVPSGAIATGSAPSLSRGACPPGRTSDYNSDGFTNSQDFFDFITCFFNPGGFGC